MLLAFISNDTKQIILWAVAIGAFVGLIALLLHTVITNRRKKKLNQQTNNATDDGVVNVDEESNLDAASANQIVLSRNVVYSAGLNGQVRAGKYALLSADQSDDKFNVRLNGLVREYASGDTVVLAEGDTISPVSGSVVLSKAE